MIKYYHQSIGYDNLFVCEVRGVTIIKVIHTHFFLSIIRAMYKINLNFLSVYQLSYSMIGVKGYTGLYELKPGFPVWLVWRNKCRIGFHQNRHNGDTWLYSQGWGHYFNFN